MLNLKHSIRQSSLSPGYKGVAQLARVKEGVDGVSWSVFTQHALMTWLPKVSVSRSASEFFEVSFIELFETALVYFSIPLTAKYGFIPLFKKFAKDPEVKNNLSHSVLELAQKFGERTKQYPHHKLGNALKGPLKQILPLKAAIVLSAMVAGGAGWEYALTFAKNLMTSKIFGKESFSDIANLTKDNTVRHDDGKDSPVVEKSKHRIKQAIGVLLGTFAAAVGLAVAGPHSKALQKLSAKFLKVFDFSFERTAKGTFVGLSNNQNRFFIATALVAYMDATRDKLEAMEVFTRLSVVLSYLAFGNEIIDNLTRKRYEKKFPKLFKEAQDELGNFIPKADGTLKMRIKTVRELFEEFATDNNILHSNALTQTTKTAQSLSTEQLKMAMRKLNLFIYPQIAGLAIAGFANAILNVLWTAHRFKNNTETHGENNHQYKAYNVFADLGQGIAQTLGLQSIRPIENNVYYQAYNRYGVRSHHHPPSRPPNDQTLFTDPISRLLADKKPLSQQAAHTLQ